MDNITICKECADSSYAPKSGVCSSTKNSAFPACTKDANRGLCTGCSSSASAFLFYGGCYDRSSRIGSRLCSQITSGTCSQWNDNFKFIFAKGGTSDTNRYLCGSAADSGVSGCATCNYEGGTVRCTRCAVGYLGVDGTSCSNSCIGNTLGECSDITEQGGSSPVVSCKCVCKPGLYNNSGTCAPCTESCAVCKNGDPNGCQQCNSGKVLESLVVTSDSARCVAECTVGSECAECGITIEGSRYCTRCKDSGMYPLNGVCITDSAQRDAYCTSRASGACNTCSSAAFLMNGGCYKSDYYPGSAVCNAQSGGKCTQAKEGYGMSADGKLQPCGPACLRCTAPGPGLCTECLPGKYMKRVPGAAAGSCIDPDACVNGYYISGNACLPCAVVGCKACGNANVCQECAGELFVSLDGRSCQEECGGDHVLGDVSDGVRRCWCERGFLPALDKSRCVEAVECPAGMEWCAMCDASGACLSCAIAGHNIQADLRTCGPGCGDHASPNQGTCVCEVDAVFEGGVCVPASTPTRRKTAAIAAGATVGVLVIGALIGFLCWWFLCKTKHAGVSSNTTTLIRSKSA
ncbi:Variant-specific surface protein [Giardia duodenalis]|uniref:Variant-specific surface protein n=1 Tax=Giardia intestinalis TaxID=5741 RepID=V6TXD9_GIAIN|nr:Variant-specific surface protein [Giardia intestinalis]